MSCHMHWSDLVTERLPCAVPGCPHGTPGDVLESPVPPLPFNPFSAEPPLDATSSGYRTVTLERAEWRGQWSWRQMIDARRAGVEAGIREAKLHPEASHAAVMRLMDEACKAALPFGTLDQIDWFQFGFWKAWPQYPAPDSIVR